MADREDRRRDVAVSRPDKLLFTVPEVTKQDLLDHYLRVSEVMLPHLRRRPAVLRRFPDGIDQGGFFQKDASDHTPGWVHTTRIERRRGGAIHHVVVDDAATLAYLADQATVEIHTWLSRIDDLERPDQLVIDLDPPGDDANAARWAARRVRDLLRELDREPLLKTSGSKGYHVQLPLDGSADFAQGREIAARLVDVLADRYPERLTVAHRKADRGGRVFLDIGRNAYGQHAVAPYSVRARAGAPVATPIGWQELGRVHPRRFTIHNVGRRLAQKDDPWAGASEAGISLQQMSQQLDDL